MKLNKIKYFTVALFLMLISCSPTKDVTKNEIVWPVPPDEPRIKYVKTLSSEDEFLSGLGKAAQIITGQSSALRLIRPFDVATDGKGKVFVSDMEQGLLLFDEVKKEVVPLGAKSILPLGRIVGIAYGNGKLFAGSAELRAVIVLDMEGRIVQTIGKQGQFPNPVDVAFDKYLNRVIVVDNKNHNVTVYSETGDSLFTIGERGEEDGQFNFPQSAAVDKNSNIYIVDAFNFRVQVFDKDGKFLRKFGQQGNLFGMFERPKGIALDTYDNIYVVDAIHNNFQIFNQNFDLLLFVGRYSEGDNYGFLNPIGITIDDNNRIYVADQLNERVQVFQLIKAD